MESNNKPYQIIVVGGGAGGLELASKLGKKLGKKKKAEITLVDANMTHLWKPLLHEVAAGTLNSYEDELNYLALGHSNHFTFRLGKMDGLDREKREISVAPSVDDEGVEYIPRRTFSYDSLIISVGSVTNDFNIKGIKEHCMFLDTRHEADVFHQHLLRSVYRANTQDTPIREGQLNIAIAGAGATGVELSAELHDAFEQLVTFGINKLSRDTEIKITIIEGADRILPALPPRLSEMTEKALQKINVDIISGHRIVEATETGFMTDKDKFVPAEIKIWAAGIKAPDFLKEIDGLESNWMNQLVVNKTLQTTRDENIFSFGDCAACPMNDEQTVPPRAQAAHQQANMLVKSVIRQMQGETNLPEYKYVDYGSLINLSRYSTVGNMMGNLLGKKAGSVMIEGLLARFVYLSLYKMHQVNIQGMIRVAFLTLANMLTEKHKPRMKLH